MTDTIINYTLHQMKAAGFEKSHCTLSFDEKQELNVENGNISLLRSGEDQELFIVGIKDQRRASISISNLNEASIKDAISLLVEMADGSEQDTAYDIAPQQPSESFLSGPQTADLDLMYDRLSEFLTYVSEHYPLIIMSECSIDYTHTNTRLVNSNGVDFTEVRGDYNGSMLFTAKDDEQSSSFSFTGFSSFDLSKPIHRYSTIETQLKHTSDSLQAKSIPDKFVGDVIITPDAIDDFIGFLTGSIRDNSLIAGTSIYKDKLNQPVASDKITLKSVPLDTNLPGGYSFTSDGFKVENMLLLDKGVLNTYLLSFYGARKTGLERAKNEGGCMVLEAGDSTLASMIASIDEGIILGRFSGGEPAEKGDFSGIAKNSLYIKNGQIQFPLSETMISGNMAKALNSVTSVSKEQVDFGDSRMPWIQVTGITIS
ncbi:hypothetical protein ACH42_00535 [Endozoicomonas sp. (ex Bugula neritina AB1)]|nr:hypothetical protein ACH42_00535 [Endozoicomonas sp. (ex Bugula neritina AB1)]